MRNRSSYGEAGRVVTAGIKGRMAAVVSVCGALLLLTATPVPAQGFVRPDLGLGFRAPDGWRPLPTDTGMPFAAVGPDNGKFSPKIILTIKRASSSTLPGDQGTRMTRQLEQTLPGFRTVSKGRFLIAGTEAVMVSGVYPAPESSGLNGLPLRNCVVCTVRGGRLYTFTFTTDRENYGAELPAFTSVVDSVRWNPKGGITTASGKAAPKPTEAPKTEDVSLEGNPKAGTVTLFDAKVSFTKPEGFVRLKFNNKALAGSGNSKLIFGAVRPTGSEGGFATNFVLEQRPAPGAVFPTDMASVTDRIFSEQFPGAQIVGQQRGNLAGTNSYTVLFDYPAPGGNLVRVRYVMLIKGSWLYTFVFFADKARFDEDDPTFNEVLGTVRWL